MYIKEVTLEGFKSYATRTVVPGFDPFFNAITGLNGSGKSNILDSICFVLGITNLQQVRAANLQELVYKQGQAGTTKATVSIVFDNSDRARSPLGYEAHSELTVTRQIREIQPLHKKFMELKQQLELKSYDLKLFQGRAEQNEHHKVLSRFYSILAYSVAELCCGQCLVKRIELELQEANTAAKEKKLLHEDCVNKVSFLEKSIKEHGNSREGRLKDLEKKIKETKALLQSASKDLK